MLFRSVAAVAHGFGWNEFGWQVIRYALIFVSAFFRQRASLGCEMVAIRSQLTFYEVNRPISNQTQE